MIDARILAQHEAQTLRDSSTKAMELANAALHRMEAHEQVCTERWSTIRREMAELKGLLARFGWLVFGGLVTTTLSLIGFIASNVMGK